MSREDVADDVLEGMGEAVLDDILCYVLGKARENAPSNLSSVVWWAGKYLRGAIDAAVSQSDVGPEEVIAPCWCLPLCLLH